MKSRFALKKNVAPIRNMIERHSLLMGIIGVLIIAILMTIINMTLYVVTGTSKLDLSRPGYESVRKEVSSEDKQNQEQSFSSSGPITKELIDEYVKSYRKKEQALKRYDTFDPTVLDNAQLNLPSNTDSVQPTANE